MLAPEIKMSSCTENIKDELENGLPMTLANAFKEFEHEDTQEKIFPWALLENMLRTELGEKVSLIQGGTRFRLGNFFTEEIDRKSYIANKLHEIVSDDYLDEKI